MKKTPKAVPSGKAKQVGTKSRRAPSSATEPIERELVREQVDLFCKIIKSDIPKKIVEIDQLRRNEFNYEHMKKKCLTSEAQLQSYFPELKTRAEVDKYGQLYSVADFSTNSFLLPNGLIPAHRALDEQVKLILDQLEDLQGYMFESCFTLDLVVPSYEKRTSFDYTLLMDIRAEFFAAAKWAIKNYCNLDTHAFDFHAGQLHKIATYPQFEDRRKAFLRSEKRVLKDYIFIVNHLFFMYNNVFDVVCKNGDKLGQLLTKARSHK